MSKRFVSDVMKSDVTVHRQASPHYGVLNSSVYYPTNHEQVRQLLGRVLTQLDAMGLPERAHKAARTLLIADVWVWWDEVTENAVISNAGCIAPVVMNPERNPNNMNEVPPSNRWGWPSEAVYLASLSNHAESD